MGALVPFDLIVSRLHERRCLKGNEALSESEHVYCAKCCSGLYGQALDSPTRLAVNNVVESIIANRDQFKGICAESAGISDEVAELFRLAINKDQGSLEHYVHSFVYIFWGDISLDGIIPTPSGRIFWLAKGGPGLEPLYKDISPGGRAVAALRRDGVEVDLVVLDEKASSIWLIDVKRDDLDDRAVGQMLRYFDRGNKLLHAREFRLANINYIRPMLILQSASARRWLSVPQHFRDLLEIVSFKATDQSQHVLCFQSIRRQLLSEPVC